MHGWNSCARSVGESEEKLSPNEHWTNPLESSPISEHSLSTAVHTDISPSVIYCAMSFQKPIQKFGMDVGEVWQLKCQRKMQK